MTIAIDCRMLGKSGIGSYFSSLLPFFLSSYQCTLIGEASLLEKYKASAVILPCTIKPFSIKDTLFFPRSLLKTINKQDCYYSPYCNIPSGIRIKAFLTIHDLVFLDIKRLTSPLGVVIRKFFYKRAVHKSFSLFTVSNYSKERILFHLKCKKPIYVTYNACNPYFDIPPMKATTRDNNLILFVGNIKKHKGLATLLEAFTRLIAKNPSLKLAIIGSIKDFRSADTKTYEALLALFNRYKDNIIIEENATIETLKSYYYKAKLLVSPSLYEGFGMIGLEALHAGANVVLSNIEVYREIYAGYPVTFFSAMDSTDLQDKIIKALSSPPPPSFSDRYSFNLSFSVIAKAIRGE